MDVIGGNEELIDVEGLYFLEHFCTQKIEVRSNICVKESMNATALHI